MGRSATRDTAETLNLKPAGQQKSYYSVVCSDEDQVAQAEQEHEGRQTRELPGPNTQTTIFN